MITVNDISQNIEAVMVECESEKLKVEYNLCEHIIINVGAKEDKIYQKLQQVSQPIDSAVIQGFVSNQF